MANCPSVALPQNQWRVWRRASCPPDEVGRFTLADEVGVVPDHLPDQLSQLPNQFGATRPRQTPRQAGLPHWYDSVALNQERALRVVRGQLKPWSTFRLTAS